MFKYCNRELDYKRQIFSEMENIPKQSLSRKDNKFTYFLRNCGLKDSITKTY